jgi:hypothetical protein
MSSSVILEAMPYNSFEAKREMLAECRACCRNNTHELEMIKTFEREYRSTDAIYWYTKPCFLYRLVNRALRTEDNIILHKFRYFIIDLCARLEQTALTSNTCPNSFRVYRGSKLSRDEAEKLKVGSLVATNSFFSSSRDRQVAQCFIGIDPATNISLNRSREDQCQYVLFEITVDLNNSPEVVITDVSDQSAVRAENELVFNLGTTFVITDARHDNSDRLWYVELTSSSEVGKLIREYRTHFQSRFVETKPVILFGHLTAEMQSNYSGALAYFHRVLRSTSWDDEDRPDIYHYLGRVYRAMGKNQQAITYFRCAQLIQRRRLPQSSMAYGRVLSCLGTVHAELGNLAQAIHLYEQAMDIYRRVLPKNHYEFGFHSNRLAQVYWQSGHYETARLLLMNTLSFVKETMPENSPGQAQTLHIMGLVQHSLNNREEAVYYFNQSLKMRETLQSNDHPYLARTCYELSVLYGEQNDNATAFEYAQRALRICETKLPLNHSQRQQVMALVQRLSHQNDTASD